MRVGRYIKAYAQGEKRTRDKARSACKDRDNPRWVRRRSGKAKWEMSEEKRCSKVVM